MRESGLRAVIRQAPILRQDMTRPVIVTADRPQGHFDRKGEEATLGRRETALAAMRLVEQEQLPVHLGLKGEDLPAHILIGLAGIEQLGFQPAAERFPEIGRRLPVQLIQPTGGEANEVPTMRKGEVYDRLARLRYEAVAMHLCLLQLLVSGDPLPGAHGSG
ncbi:MAG: hypothetical protein ABS40_19835 [Agrobacterium sp. SCN 61-19]|nr:MAG: hypothetical protein ABS40_19835 [Agrobacterium sp. SCN 61-19]